VFIKLCTGINGLLLTSLIYASVEPLIPPKKFPGFDNIQVTQVESEILKKYQNLGYKDATLTIHKESDYLLKGRMYLNGQDSKGSIECSASKQAKSGDIHWSCYEPRKSGLSKS